MLGPDGVCAAATPAPKQSSGALYKPHLARTHHVLTESMAGLRSRGLPVLVVFSSLGISAKQVLTANNCPAAPVSCALCAQVILVHADTLLNTSPITQRISCTVKANIFIVLNADAGDCLARQSSAHSARRYHHQSWRGSCEQQGFGNNAFLSFMAVIHGSAVLRNKQHLNTHTVQDISTHMEST